MMRRVVRAGDRLLSRAQGIIELDPDPRCLLRVRIVRTRAPLSFPAHYLPAGTRVVELHAANERMPPLPAEGPTLAWAVRGEALMRSSMRHLAAYVATAPEAADAAGALGFTALFAAGSGAGAERFFQRFGFETAPSTEQPHRVREFWRKLHTWLILWAYNRTSARRRGFAELRHSMLWMPRDALLARWLDG